MTRLPSQHPPPSPSMLEVGMIRFSPQPPQLSPLTPWMAVLELIRSSWPQIPKPFLIALLGSSRRGLSRSSRPPMETTPSRSVQSHLKAASRRSLAGPAMTPSMPRPTLQQLLLMVERVPIASSAAQAMTSSPIREAIPRSSAGPAMTPSPSPRRIWPPTRWPEDMERIL